MACAGIHLLLTKSVIPHDYCKSFGKHGGVHMLAIWHVCYTLVPVPIHPVGKSRNHYTKVPRLVLKPP